MPHVEASSAAQALPPKHRRSFSGIRTSFGLSSSPSLPVIGSNKNQSALNITTPSRPSTTESDNMRNASHRGHAVAFGSSSNSSSSSKSVLPSGIRSLRSKFSFGSSSIAPATPVRSSSNGSISTGAGGGFMAKLPFGSLSRSSSKQKALHLSTLPTELVSPFSTFQNEDDDKGPVMRISAFPPSPGSVVSNHSLPSERGANVPLSPPPSPSPPTPYYPATLGKGIPRSLALPSTSSLSESKVASTTQNALVPPVREDRSPSPNNEPLQGISVSSTFNAMLILDA